MDFSVKWVHQKLGMEKLKFILKYEKLSEFIEVIEDLSKIKPVVRFKFESHNLLIYSCDTPSDASTGNQSIISFKSYNFEKDYFFEFSDEYNKLSEEKFDFITKNVKIFKKKLSFFQQHKNDIKGEFNIKDERGEYLINSLKMSNGKFTFSLVGQNSSIIKDISLNKLNLILDPENSEFHFSFSKKDFLNVKKASEIELEEIISILIKQKGIYFSQSSWELLVSKPKEDFTKSIHFDRKHLKSLNPKEDTLNFWIYPRFILFKEQNKNMMISYEQNF
jgi:hypothetical protein